jgi:hypothetical protein
MMKRQNKQRKIKKPAKHIEQGENYFKDVFRVIKEAKENPPKKPNSKGNYVYKDSKGYFRL